MTACKKSKALKKAKLRYNEYYNIQEVFDDLYDKSKKGYVFKNLVEIIASEENIKLAYRRIKRNKGSKTSGVNGRTILDIAETDMNKFIQIVRKRLQNYKPHQVRRVEIKKDNGKTRPLGIPTIDDRIIQQCILQVLEPICEAKFYKHSYGFRPNRSAHHAIARAYYLINKSKQYYCVDIDIKSFFDNVNHAKLIKQMWNLGIRDKNLICIIGKMLKAEIKGIGIPTKGTPQGGILSPLLSNIVLNELDWWVASQWDTFETKHNYDRQTKANKINKGHKYRALRNTNLKEMYLVRYADDFKIFCSNHSDAVRIKIAVIKWLKERLGLEVNEDKSKITNLKKNYTEFLGIKLKATPKGKKRVVMSHITDKAQKKMVDKLKKMTLEIKRHPTQANINRYNAMVLGWHQYYSVATHVNKDFSKIHSKVRNTQNVMLNKLNGKEGKLTEAFKKHYQGYNIKTFNIAGIKMFPIAGIRTKPPNNFKDEICNYTKEGRLAIHRNLSNVNMNIVKYLMKNPIEDESVEYNDNRISVYIAQYGKCKVTDEILQIGNMHCHHIKPKHRGGTDSYRNLIFVTEDVHRLIHAKTENTIQKYLSKVKPDDHQLEVINELRGKAGRNHIKR